MHVGVTPTHTHTRARARARALSLSLSRAQAVYHTISRSREVGQSYASSVLSTLFAVAESFPIVFRVKPDLVRETQQQLYLSKRMESLLFFFSHLFQLYN